MNRNEAIAILDKEQRSILGQIEEELKRRTGVAEEWRRPMVEVLKPFSDRSEALAYALNHLTRCDSVD